MSRSPRSKKRKRKSAPPSSTGQLRPVVISPAVLRRWPLPQPDHEGDKEERGRVLIVGGAAEMPGAVILAANAALRAGAGKLQIATCRSIAPLVALAVPEARVFSLPETKDGSVAASAASVIAGHASEAQAVLFGPGMVGEAAAARLVEKLLPKIGRTTVVLDAVALSCLKESPACLLTLNCRAVLTPNAGEMAKMLGVGKPVLARDPLGHARRAADKLCAVIALKGAETFIVAPKTAEAYSNRAGNVGLALSGSGDVLAGIVAGLAARGATPLQAAVWGVYLHARAGEALARRGGVLGYLARELAGEVPALMSALDKRQKR